MANILVEAIQANIAASMSGDQDLNREAVESWLKDQADARQVRKLKAVQAIREEYQDASSDGDLDPMFKGAYAKVLKNIVG